MLRPLARVIAALAMSAAVTAPAAAQPSRGLAFVDERPITLSWNRVSTGVSLPVCNAGERRLQFRPRLSGFDFAVSGELIEDEEVLKPPSAPASVRSLGCTPVMVKARGRPIPDPGKYTGVIVVVGQAGLIRRELTIIVPRTGGTPGEGRSLFEEVTLTARREALPPWDKTSELNHNETLVFAPLVPGKEPPLPAAGKLLGTLQHEDTGDGASVVVTDEPRRDKFGRLLLPIRLEGADKVGTYSGTLDVGAGGAEPIKVKTAVKVGDWISLAIAAVILGGLLATLGMLWLQRWQPWLHLRNRRNTLPGTYEKAERTFESDFTGKPFVDYTVTSTSISAYRDGLREALDRYRRNTFLFDRASEDYKKIVRMTQTAEDDAAMFADRKRLGKSLSTLQTSLETFLEHLAQDPDFQYPRGQPAFVARAARLVRPTAPVEPGSSESASAELEVGQATSIAAQADSYVALIGTWKTMEVKVKRYVRWALYLQGKAAQMSWRDRQILEAAAARVVEAKNEMFDAVDADTLKALDSEGDLQRAYAGLAYLGARYGWSPPAATVTFEDLLEGARVMELTESKRYLFRSVETASTATAEQVVEELAAEAEPAGKLPEIRSAAIETVSRSIAWLGDAGALALALLTGVVGGLVAFYDAETFGSLTDYLKALGLGAGATIIAKNLVDTLAQIRRVERV